MRQKQIKNWIFVTALRLALGVCLLGLGALIGAIVFSGIKSLSLYFWLTPAGNFGASGGILYQIIGSLLMTFTAALFVLPVATGTALLRSEYIRPEAAKRWLDMSLYALNAIPSVTYGIFGLIVFVNVLGMGISWMAGAFILAIMMLPTVTLASCQAIEAIPSRYKENAMSLGLSQDQIVTRVILPQSAHGIMTGLFLALAKAIGETAPIMFIATAFSGAGFPRSFFEPVASLPTHILALAQQATNPAALANAWGASLTLILLVALFSGLSLYARLKFNTLSDR